MTTRQRLERLLKERQNWSMAELARSLGVSRQRVATLLKQSGRKVESQVVRVTI